MRVPGGERLTDQEWSHLSETRLEDKAAFQSPEALVQATGDWYESCYLWSITTLIAFIKARHSAREANQTLFFVPAADWPDQACEPHHLKHLLGVSNLSTTKKTARRKLIALWAKSTADYIGFTPLGCSGYRCNNCRHCFC